LLTEYSKAEGGMPVARVRHAIGVVVICSIVDRVLTEEGGYLFVTKGGSAIQMRLGLTARATRAKVPSGAHRSWSLPISSMASSSDQSSLSKSHSSQVSRIRAAHLIDAHRYGSLHGHILSSLLALREHAECGDYRVEP
jgi:hypothetical protein